MKVITLRFLGMCVKGIYYNRIKIGINRPTDAYSPRFNHRTISLRIKSL